jgi:transcriptional regulator with XRE-family HTH domain
VAAEKQANAKGGLRIWTVRAARPAYHSSMEYAVRAWFRSSALRAYRAKSGRSLRAWQEGIIVPHWFGMLALPFLHHPRNEGRATMVKSTVVKFEPRSSGKPEIEIGKKIRLRRVEQRISQSDLGEKLGISFQQVQKYEKGVNRVGAARLQQIATALDVPVTFFYDSNSKTKEVESLLFLDSAYSLRLLRAYSKIKDQAVQRHMVSLMEVVADNEHE